MRLLVWIYERVCYNVGLNTNDMNRLRFKVVQLSDRFEPGPSADMNFSEDFEISTEAFPLFL